MAYIAVDSNKKAKQSDIRSFSILSVGRVWSGPVYIVLLKTCF